MLWVLIRSVSQAILMSTLNVGFCEVIRKILILVGWKTTPSFLEVCINLLLKKDSVPQCCDKAAAVLQQRKIVSVNCTDLCH